MSAGPEERRWQSRLHYKMLGRWPNTVVEERLSHPWTPPEDLKAIFREQFEQADHPVPPEYR
jgi:hypothetical protein